MSLKKKSNSGTKKKSSWVTKIGLPALVIAVVGGSFFVNWNHFGRSPVSYYGLGAVPMMGMCPAKVDKASEKVVPQPKPKPTTQNKVEKHKNHKKEHKN